MGRQNVNLKFLLDKRRLRYVKVQTNQDHATSTTIKLLYKKATFDKRFSFQGFTTVDELRKKLIIAFIHYSEIFRMQIKNVNHKGYASETKKIVGKRDL